MDREDRMIVNSERDASSQNRRSAHFDPHDTTTRRYDHLRPDQRDALHLSMASESTGPYSNDDAESVELEEVETAEIPPEPREFRSSEPLSQQNTVELQEIGTRHVNMSRKYSQAAPIGRTPTGISSVSGLRRGSVKDINRTETNESSAGAYSSGYTNNGFNNRYSWISRSPTNTNTPANRRYSRALSRTETINTLEHNLDALDRIETQRVQQYTTIGKAEDAKPVDIDSLPAFGAGKPYPPDLPDQEEFVVEFDGPDDPLHGQNWTMKRKCIIVAMLAFDSIASTMGSAIYSPGVNQVAHEYHVLGEVATIGTSIFVLGFAFGPIMWAPFSELYGRRMPLLISAFGFAVFGIAVATAENLQTIMICRFFNGVFGSCPLACVAAVFADIFDNKLRGLAIAVFATMVFMGPFLAPFLGGFITTSHLGWRWTEYISSIMGFTAFGILLLFLPETYPPAILVGKAAELRRATLNWGIHAKQEEVEVDLKELLTKNVSRPLRLLFTEPIVLAVSIYMSFVYGLLYGFLTAYNKVFVGKYGFSEGVGGLPYFGMIAGEVLAFICVCYLNGDYVKKLAANNNIPVPEWRLPIVMVSGFLFAGGLFWFGWSGYTGHTHWIVPTLSGLFSGFGIFAIFLQLMNYIVDAYLMFAASALAANTFLRSLVACAFPLFSGYMLDNMGIEWGLTLLGCIALLCTPMPFIFFYYGKRIRAKSKFAPSPDIEQDKRRDEESRMSVSEEKTLS